MTENKTVDDLSLEYALNESSPELLPFYYLQKGFKAGYAARDAEMQELKKMDEANDG